MAQTYSEFKAHILETLWQTNNATLVSELDTIILKAHAELNRKLDLDRRNVTVTIAPEAEDYDLPADFYQMKSLSNRQPERQSGASAFMSSTVLQTILTERARTNSARIVPLYHIDRASSTNTLYLVGPFSASNPGDMVLQYRTTVPDYATLDSSWLEDEYLDLYEFAVFKHCAVFLREDERLAAYTGLLTEAIASAVDEDNRHVKFGGSPLKMQPHRPVPRRR